MFSNTVWIRPEYENGGYSTARHFEDADILVSIGGSGRYDVGIIAIDLKKAHFTVVGNDKEITDFRLASNKHDFAFRIALSYMDSEHFRVILDNCYKEGIRDGREALRKSFVALLKEEY
jgi:hypothetical protein